MRVGIVNAKPLAIEGIRRAVDKAPNLRVAWIATCGENAIERARRDPPDLVLLDPKINHPGGVEVTRQVVQQAEVPVLLVAESSDDHSDLLFDALGQGALDAAVAPPLRASEEEIDALLSKIEQALRLTGHRAQTDRAAPKKLPPLLALGASTGGPEALAHILQALGDRKDQFATAIVQHVDEQFVEGLIGWLSKRIQYSVEPAHSGILPRAGRVYLASQAAHLIVTDGGQFCYTQNPAGTIHRPSIDVFFTSLAKSWKRAGVGILLTGMGRDGALGLLEMRTAGWWTITQDEASSVVFGMPKAAMERSAACEVLSLEQIGPSVVRHLRS